MSDPAAASAQDIGTLRHLLDIISGAPRDVTGADRAAALTELTGLLFQTGLRKTALEMLISGALFRIRGSRDSNFVMNVIQQVKGAKEGASLEDIDRAAFFPKRAGKALENLTDIPEDLHWLFKRAAPEVLAGLSVEELAVFLCSTATPDWLVRIILSDQRLLGLLGQFVYPSYGWFSLPADGVSDEQKEAELAGTLEQARKVLEWVNKCPAEYLPAAIEPCSPDIQECAAGRLAKELGKFPADKLLTLISLDFLPAWLRKAAEKRFQDIAKSAAANSPERTERRKRRKPIDIQPTDTNGTAG
jgi:hypothetical protein